jgi:hypothetical protein
MKLFLYRTITEGSIKLYFYHCKILFQERNDKQRKSSTYTKERNNAEKTDLHRIGDYPII